MYTILEHFHSALCNLKKGGIDLSLNKWVELVSICTTDFSLTGIFFLFPFRLYAPACDIIMCIPLVVSAHNFPIHKKYVLQHRYASAL